MTIDAYLKARADRCPGCGHHVATQGHGASCAPTAPTDEWTTFKSALRTAAVNGVVHQADVRPLIRGRVHHKHVGQFYARAKRDGLLVRIGKEPSCDAAGRNTHHESPIYELRSVA